VFRKSDQLLDTAFRLLWGENMLKRTGTAILGIIVLALLAGDHFTNLGSTPSERIFSKYKAKHAFVRADITALGEDLREILKTRDRAAAPRIYIALLAELARLKGEVQLIESWEKGTLDKTESIGLMADSLLVLEYLQMTTAYARAINDSMRKTATEGRALASTDTLEQAAKNFPEYYEKRQTGTTVFDDAEILTHSREAGRLVPIAKALFDTPDAKAAVGYRVRFFARYADNIIEKNREKLQAFQRSLVKNGSLAPR
jgi:hypothetical protein